jgi:hypothetical protein
MSTGIWLMSAAICLIVTGVGWLFFSRARRFADQHMDSVASGPIKQPTWIVGETSRRIEAGINRIAGVIAMIGGAVGFVLSLLYFFGVATPPSS